jgi:hypothetical protein
VQGKEYRVVYTEALTEAFASVYALINITEPKFKFNRYGTKPCTTVVENLYLLRPGSFDTKDVNLLYARYIYGLSVNRQHQKLMKLKTSQANSFIAIKDSVQGL